MARQSDRSRLRRTFTANGATAILAVVVLAAAALTVRPPAPPTIAEFAPQAADTIDEAAEGQDAGVASPPGEQQESVTVEEDAEDAPLPAEADTDVIEGVPSVLQCTTWPDGSVTQTYDRQSPPCVATWMLETGNGGVTSRGVTETEILVGVVQAPFADYVALVEHFNAKYQFYGRRIRLIELEFDGLIFTAEGRQAAAEAAAEAGVFAVLTVSADDDTAMRRQLADDGILSISEQPSVAVDRPLLDELHPYAWGYYPAADELLSDAASFSCASLVGRPAQYAGPRLEASQRTWAFLYRQPRQAPRPPVDAFVLPMVACGVDVQVVEMPNDQQARVATLADLAVAETTTLVCGALSTDCGGWMSESTPLNYQPEWMLTGLPSQAEDSNWTSEGSVDQRLHLFGVAPWNRALPTSHRPATQAYAETEGRTPPLAVDGKYHQLLVLAAGIQGAGPVLTPETFAAGLLETAFPNPGAGAAPDYQAPVDVTAAGHAMISDSVLVSWREEARSHYDNPSPGAFCFVDGGSRWDGGSWPQDPAFFAGDC